VTCLFSSDAKKRWRDGFLALLLLLAIACDSTEQTIEIIAEDFRFTPAELRLSAQRPIHLMIANQGRERHEFTSPLLTHQVGGSGGGSSVPLSPMQKVEIVIRAQPGVYLFSCAIRGHAGMSGTIIVE
jgi:uncharacterized cupredoxin-like copper-binding protein